MNSNLLEGVSEQRSWVAELDDYVMAFARRFQKKRGIFGEHKKRMYKGIVSVMEKEDPEIIESLKLFMEG